MNNSYTLANSTSSRNARDQADQLIELEERLITTL
jgi:hypothetical protein